MTKKISPLWVRSTSSTRVHRKREYTKKGGITLCGIHLGPAWYHVADSKLRKCKRCAA